jgi:uncharacterized protein (DUF362 family)
MVPAMVAAGLKELTETSDLAEAWRRIIPGWIAGQQIGLKVNTLGAGKALVTSVHLIRAMVASLKESGGVPEGDLLVWDRRDDELWGAYREYGYLEAFGCPCYGTQESTKGNGKRLGYEDQPVCVSGRKTHLSKILTQELDHLINLAVVKHHTVSGFSGCLKNLYGVIDNPIEFHDNWVNDIANLAAQPVITGLSRLYVLDALSIICFGSNYDSADWAYGKILFSFDPVAIDQRGKELRIDAYLEKVKDNPEATPDKIAEILEKEDPKYLSVAEGLKLGTTKYELVPVDVEADAG